MRGFRFWSVQETRGLTAALLGVLGLTIGYRCAFFACFFISHNCVISSWPERRMRRNMCNWVFWSAHSLTCSWFVLRRPVLLFTLPFGGGNGYKLFISPSASALPLTFLLYVKPPYVFVITPQRTPPPPIFYFTHSSGGPLECGPCNYYLVLIGYHMSGTKL